MSLRRRLILLVGLVALVSAALFALSLLYVARSTLGFWENPKIERGIEIAAGVQADPAVAAEGRQAYTAYHHLKAVKGLVEQRIAGAAVLFGLVVFGLSLGVSLVALVRMTRPLNELAAAINRAGTGDLSVKVAAAPGSEVGRVAEAFNAMTDRLHRLQQELRRSERLAAWRDVARVLAHEIRNPLTPIRLSVERLQERAARNSPDLAEVTSRSAVTIIEEVEALDRIVREFGEFARLPQPSKRAVALDRLLGSVVDEYRAAYPAVKFGLDCPGLELQLDPEQMRRVFANVLKNGVEALAGRADGRVDVAVRVEAGAARLTFSDNGPGITEAVRLRAFEPYFTTKEHGTGLGLAVCRNIVAEHGGTVELGWPAQGAEVTITLGR